MYATKGLCIIVVSLLVVLTTGCTATMKAYPSSELPKDQIATVEVPFSFLGAMLSGAAELPRVDIIVTHVDGVLTNVNKYKAGQKIQLLPGQHEIRVHVLMYEFKYDPLFRRKVQKVTYHSPSPCPITFQAEPGRVYRVKAGLNRETMDRWRDTWDTWIVDTQTGAEVHGVGCSGSNLL